MFHAGVERSSFLAQHLDSFSKSKKVFGPPKAGVFHVEFIKASHNLFLFEAGAFFPVVHHAAADAQELALSPLTNLGMLFFDQLGAPYRPSCLDFFCKKSTSMLSCPIFLSSTWRSFSNSSLPPRFAFPRSKAPPIPSSRVFFHSDTCTG